MDISRVQTRGSRLLSGWLLFFATLFSTAVLLASDCNPATGLSAPLPVCSQADPCSRAAALGGGSITTPSDIPVCRTTESDRPFFDDGSPQAWTDPLGVERYACIYRPTGASARSPRPLLLFFHGGQGHAGNIYDSTSLRSKAESFPLSGRRDQPGFFLVSVQGRNLRSPNDGSLDGPKHDDLFRDLASPSANPDIANADRLIDQLTRDPAVDRSRIYLMGWSNGGFFAQMYAIARHSRPTPDRNRVASAAVYSTADPFNALLQDSSPSCRLDPYPNSTVPIVLLSRACDILACDAAQARGLELWGLRMPPGYVVQTWIRDLGTRVGDPNVMWRIVRGDGVAGTACTAPFFCSLPLAFANHLHWPDGVADRSGIDHEPGMLEFLRDHPLHEGIRVVAPRP